MKCKSEYCLLKNHKLLHHKSYLCRLIPDFGPADAIISETVSIRVGSYTNLQHICAPPNPHALIEIKHS